MTIEPSHTFKWSEDPDVLIREQLAIAVYTNCHRAVVIRQERAWDEDSDLCIIVQAKNVRQVAEAMLKEVSEEELLALPAPQSEPAAAEPQRQLELTGAE